MKSSFSDIRENPENEPFLRPKKCFWVVLFAQFEPPGTVCNLHPHIWSHHPVPGNIVQICAILVHVGYWLLKNKKFK